MVWHWCFVEETVSAEDQCCLNPSNFFFFYNRNRFQTIKFEIVCRRMRPTIQNWCHKPPSFDQNMRLCILFCILLLLPLVKEVLGKLPNSQHCLIRFCLASHWNCILCHLLRQWNYNCFLPNWAKKFRYRNDVWKNIVLCRWKEKKHYYNIIWFDCF